MVRRLIIFACKTTKLGFGIVNENVLAFAAKSRSSRHIESDLAALLGVAHARTFRLTDIGCLVIQWAINGSLVTLQLTVDYVWGQLMSRLPGLMPS
jgi:hypothetical protein